MKEIEILITAIKYGLTIASLSATIARNYKLAKITDDTIFMLDSIDITDVYAKKDIDFILLNYKNELETIIEQNKLESNE